MDTHSESEHFRSFARAEAERFRSPPEERGGERVVGRGNRGRRTERERVGEREQERDIKEHG